MKSSAHYDTYDYPAYWKGRDYEHASEVYAIDSFLKNIKHIHTLADIGGGFGRLIPHYEQKTEKVILAEPSQTLIDVAKEKFSKNAKVCYECSSIENLTSRIKKGSLDAIVMVRVMHHLKDPKETIKTLSSLLKKDGLLILEFANKIHGKALIENFCRGEFTFPIDITPSDRRCAENKTDEVISFYNYHPDTIFDALKTNKMKVKEVRSVSNVRSQFIKKHIPFELLMKIEEALQAPLARVYFGPSIFVLAQKRG